MVIDINKCTGCSLCSYICPNNAIKMKYSKDSFFINPIIDSEKCVDCNLCKRMCPEINNVPLMQQKKRFLAQNDDISTLNGSTSGGIASALAEYFTSKGGVVYGAAFNSKMILEHIRCEDKASCNRIKGSKYIQSEISSVYESINLDLDNEKPVLFIGTPCQCAAVKQLFKNRGAFFCCDFICNGVASPIVFNYHIAYLEKLYKCKVQRYVFRPKHNHYLEPYEEFYDVDNKKYRIKSPWKKWGSIYYAGLAMRYSCYECRYSCNDRVGNITFSDIPLSFLNNDNSCFRHSVKKKGASFISINDDKGEMLLNEIKNLISYEEIAEEITDNKKHEKHSIDDRDDFCLKTQVSIEKAKICHIGRKVKIKSMIIDAFETIRNRRI